MVMILSRSQEEPYRSPEDLSKELLVAREILRFEEEEGRPVEFDELAERVANHAPEPIVSQALDILFDQGVVKAEWIKTPEDEPVRGFRIAGEAQDFVHRVLEQTR